MPDSESARIHSVYAHYTAERAGERRWSLQNKGNRAILNERKTVVAATLKKCGYSPLARQSILEIGCGSGRVLRELIALGATPTQLHGIDLLAERIAMLKREVQGVHVQVGDARALPLPDASFDLVFAFTVFSSILESSITSAVAAEVHRVLKPRGAVVIYDMRRANPLNQNVRPLRRTELQRLFPGYSSQTRTLTVLPPIARRLGLLTQPLYFLLARIPLLRTHLLSLLQKPAVKESA